MKSITLLTAAVAALLTASASAQSIWDENIDGDLSDDHLNPTGPVNLSLGSNTITGSTISGDRDYITLIVPGELQLSQIFVDSYSGDDLAFIALQQGTQVTDPDAPVVGDLLGYTHFGTANNTVGTNILDDIGQGDGAIGFTGPLGPGTYSVWIQETGGVSVSYGLDFIVTDIPAPGALTLLGLAAIAPRRRRSV